MVNITVPHYVAHQSAAPHSTKRTPVQRAADLRFISDWALQGFSCQQIAEKLRVELGRPYEISSTQIGRDLKKVMAIWVSDTKIPFELRKAKMLEGLELQRRELWEAWEKSKKDAEKSKQTGLIVKAEVQGQKGTPMPMEFERVREGQCGDPSYMRLILDIETRIAKLHGMDAPEEKNLTVKHVATPSELLAIGADIIERIRNGNGNGHGLTDGSGTGQPDGVNLLRSQN